MEVRVWLRVLLPVADDSDWPLPVQRRIVPQECIGLFTEGCTYTVGSRLPSILGGGAARVGKDDLTPHNGSSTLVNIKLDTSSYMDL